MQPVFCFSVGRSGSTLLLRLLNSHEDFALSGEHAGFLKPLLHEIDRMQQDPVRGHLLKGYEERQSGDEVFSPWRQNHPPEHFVATTARYIQDTFEQPGKVWGFKETRYKAPEVEVFQKIFPDAHYVLLVRDPLEHTLSAMFAFFRDVPAEDDDALVIADKRLRNWIKTYEAHKPVFENQVIVTYEDLAAGPEGISAVFRQLGHEPPSADQIDNVLNAKLGSSFVKRRKARQRKEATTALITDRSEFYPRAVELYEELKQS